ILIDSGKVMNAPRTKVSELQQTDHSCKFTAMDFRLNPLVVYNASSNFQPDRLLQVIGLKDGKYKLRIDGKELFTHSAEDWSKREQVFAAVENEQIEKLRAAINAKNKLYFYRWRPQNETYLFGFRKHEQGKNAAEVVQFDP